MLPQPEPERDPEVQELLLESLKLIAKAEGLYDQLSTHQREMTNFLRKAQDLVQVPEEDNG
jgi:hypothetical protein